MNVKNLILGIGIVIVFALVLWQGIEAFQLTGLMQQKKVKGILRQLRLHKYKNQKTR